MDHKVITNQAGSIHYWVAGQGKACIVFTHGATMDHGMFQHQVAYFKDRYMVIAWDVPAHGLSRPYDGFSMRAASEDLVSILDAEGVDQAHLVGQSMGGYISQITALEHPERVRTLTPVDSSPIQGSYYSRLDKWLLSITPALLRLYPYSSLIEITANQIALDETARAYALETLKGYTKAEIAEIMGAVYGDLAAFDQDFRLALPILIVVGEADHTGKVQTYSSRWAERENRPLMVIPKAAHNANMDNPGYFNRVLEEFIGNAI
jgi:pimeloyl-ACP methyl ester carboxylesterase